MTDNEIFYKHESQHMIWIIFICLSFLYVPVYADTSVNITQTEKTLLLENEVIVREISVDKKNGKMIEAVGIFPALLDNIYEVLIDFERYKDFMPNVSKVEVLQLNNKNAILNYYLSLPLGKIKKYRVNIDFEKSDRKAMLKWKMIPWQGLKKSETIEDTTGYWHLENYENKKDMVLVLYHVYTDPGPVPLGLGWIVDILTKSSVPDVIIKTREYVCSKP